MKIGKLIYLLLLLICLIVFVNSCDINDVPLRFRPEYTYANMDELLFNYNVDYSEGTMQINYGCYQYLGDTIYNLYFSAAFIDFSRFSNNGNGHLKINAGKIHIAGIQLEFDTLQNYYKRISFSSKSDSAKLFFETSNLWSVDSTTYEGYDAFQQNVYLPKPLILGCNFKDYDTISMNTDLEFRWEPENNIKTKMAVLLTNYNRDSMVVSDLLQWHEIITDNGIIKIPKEVYLQHLYPGAYAIIQIARAYDVSFVNGYKLFHLRMISSDQYTFIMK